MNRFYGYRKSPPKLAGQRPDVHIYASGLAFTQTPPKEFDLTHLVVDVIDQFGVGACVLNAWAQAIRMRMVAQQVDAWLLARRESYQLCLMADGNPGVDMGTHPRQAGSMFNKFGYGKETDFPYFDASATDDEIAASLREPVTEEYLRAAFDQKSPLLYARLSEGAAALYQVQQAIAGGFPVVFGSDVSNDFASGNFDPTKPFDPTVGTIDGGHCQTICGYRAGFGLRVVNSWSADFGDNGYWWMSEAALAKCTDLWTVEISAVEGEV